ncbi:MAG: hypothetical protein U0R78_18460 [Nocardioidaceae bacterium]
MTPSEAARIVDSRDGPAFVALMRDADAEFEDDSFEPAVADALRAEPELIRRWHLWSRDQRWTPSAFVEGLETGWYDGGNRHVRTHQDQASAVADFIHRMASWMAQRRVIEFDQ